MWLLLEGQAVLHPVLVVSVGEVFSGVSTSGFLSRCCCFGRLDTDSLATASKKIPKNYGGILVTYAQVNKFRNSRVSTKSEFQIMLRSLVPTSLNVWSTSLIFRTPSSSDSCVRNTLTSVCIVFCMASRMSCVLLGPSAVRIWSSTLMESAPASALISL